MPPRSALSQPRATVEPAFMSTTLDENVAMGYAGADRSRMGLVIEVQQGMVNRGADISWLSQYPHEKVSRDWLHLLALSENVASTRPRCQEILFGPLTGIEVLRTRTDGSIVVIECAFSINLTALTLEQ
eukprot:6854237-Prymnesium_polylepis.3